MLADTYDRVTYLTKRLNADSPDDYIAFSQTVIALVWLIDAEAGEKLYALWAKDYHDYYTPDQLRDELWEVLRGHGLEHTPWDKFLPWIHRELHASGYTVSDAVTLLHDLPEWQRATKTDLGRLTFAQVALAMSFWHAADVVKRIAHRFANGWYVLRLWRRKELEDEGEQMDHCVGGLEWYQEVRAGTKAIYSLRDPDGAPHVTLEWNPRALEFVQMMMHGDEHPPSAQYRDMLAEFVRAMPGKRPADHLVADLLLAGIPARDLDWRGVGARRWDLAGADLRGADLSGADLAQANLLNANLTDAQLRGANLTGVDLYDANLTRADLTGANLTGADLIGVNLPGANLTGANLYGARLTGVNLRGANLHRADLTGVNLRSANLRGANLIGAYLTGADLRGADLRDANLTDAVLRGADLTDADLRDANLTDAVLRGADLTDADLTRADLTGADLTGADLTRADLTRADLGNAIFDENTTLPDGSKWRPAAGLGRRARRGSRGGGA